MGTTTRRCSTCGKPHPVELQMKVKAGPELTLLSCNACDNRSWLVDGEVVEVGAVLAAAAGDEDFVLEPGRRTTRRQASASTSAGQ